MSRYEFAGQIVVQNAESTDEALEEIEELLHTINKGPDNPRVYLESPVPTNIDEEAE